MSDLYNLMKKFNRLRYLNLKTTYLSVLLTLLVFCGGYGQSNYFFNKFNDTSKDSVEYFQIKIDTLFNSRQTINILALPQNSLNKYQVKIAYNRPKLMKTSTFGEDNNALAAINGSFFEMDTGGSVAYLELNDSTIYRTKRSGLKWSKPDTLLNGAIIITKENKIVIQPAHPDLYYEQSKQEKAVLVSGPLLLLNSKRVRLHDMEFAKKRHPRTFLCLTKEYILFITVDGRSEQSNGMSLSEAQQFLLDLGCVDAINLDGGGSTTMWIKDKGVVNSPSDKAGERPVADAVLIIRK